MGRTHGKVYVTIWDDPAWRRLTQDAQWLYELMLTQKDLTLAGVLPLTPSRWSKFAADSSTERVTAAMHVLEVDSFIVVDEYTEEVLIRSLARRETQWSNSKMAGGFLSALDKVHSPKLVNALVTELNRVDHLPPRVAEALAVRSPDPSTDPSTDRSEPDRKRLEKEEVRREKGEVTPSSSPPRERGRRAETPTRIPDPFVVTDDMWAWSLQQAMPVEFVERATAKFENYWRALPGARGKKLDWTATWRNWLMNEADRNGGRAPGGVPLSRRQAETDDMFDRAMTRAEQREAAQRSEISS